MRDPYDILGVSAQSSVADIKSAYHKLARDNHPDRHPDNPAAAERFKEISAAYGLLSDVDKRRRFDAGEIDAQGQERAQRGGWSNWGGRSPFEDMFRHQRGRAGGGRGPRIQTQGANVTYTLKVNFIDAACGAKRRVAMTSGKHFYVTVPAGTEDGQVLRLKGQGMPGMGGGAPGDAHVEILVSRDDTFTREGLDILCPLPISLAEAMLGGKVDVPTVHGTVTMNVPAGANSGTKMRLKGRGIKPSRGTPGDQYVTLSVVLPEEPNAELTEFIRTWSAKNPYSARKSTEKTS